MSNVHLKKHIGNVWMDSRKIKEGDIFLALKSENDDGHNYVSSALKKGAIAAIVSKRKASRYSAREKKKLIIVANPLRAVQKMATEYLERLDIPVVAVTGSSGKTTTRQFITKVINAGFTAGTAEGNWNNHIGVPLSVLKLTGEEDVAIFELGANHTNEINTLSRIVKPDVGIITNIGYAHIGYFGNLTAITDAKFEIVNGMHKKDGLLLLNGDDNRLVKMNKNLGKRAMYFGTSSRCGIRAENIKVTSKGSATFSVKGHKYSLSMPGRHFIYSALPAIFIARQLGLSEKVIARVLYSIRPDPMRGRIVKKSGITFILDCYNANPSSMKSGIALLEDVSFKKDRCAVIGDMLELGKFSKRLHKQLGSQLSEAGVKKLITVGEFAEHVAEGAVLSGMKTSRIHCASDAESALSLVKKVLQSGDTVLLKGSRLLKLEKIYEAF
jgi:UDP-N-acetylmuramoyl-tripeptide--D-alanyl-D-alanine ligase